MYGQLPPPGNLRCTDVLLPKAIKIQWETPQGYSFPQFTVSRNGTYLGTTSDAFWTDTFDFTSGANYQYSVVFHSADPPVTHRRRVRWWVTARINARPRAGSQWAAPNPPYVPS